MIHFLASIIIASTTALGPFPANAPTELFNEPLNAEPSIDVNNPVFVKCEVDGTFLYWTALGMAGGTGAVGYRFDGWSLFLCGSGVKVTNPHTQFEVISFPQFGFITILHWRHSGTIGIYSQSRIQNLHDGTEVMNYIFLNPESEFKEYNATATFIGGQIDVTITVGN